MVEKQFHDISINIATAGEWHCGSHQKWDISGGIAKNEKNQIRNNRKKSIKRTSSSFVVLMFQDTNTDLHIASKHSNKWTISSNQFRSEYNQSSLQRILVNIPVQKKNRNYYPHHADTEVLVSLSWKELLPKILNFDQDYKMISKQNIWKKIKRNSRVTVNSKNRDTKK